MPTIIGIRKTIFNMVRPQFNTQERNFIAFEYHNLRARAHEVIRARGGHIEWLNSINYYECE